MVRGRPQRFGHPGGLPSKSDEDARGKTQIKSPEGGPMWLWLKFKLTPKEDFSVVSVRAFFVNFFMHSTKRYLDEQIVTLHHKHPNWDQNLQFTPHSETRFIPFTFIWAAPPRFGRLSSMRANFVASPIHRLKLRLEDGHVQIWPWLQFQNLCQVW